MLHIKELQAAVGTFAGKGGLAGRRPRLPAADASHKPVEGDLVIERATEFHPAWRAPGSRAGGCARRARRQAAAPA